jgi:hypothetical protein
MASYISSNANRFYTAIESAYGELATLTAANRIPAVRLAVKHQRENPERKDKTGTRTFPGLPAGGRRKTSYELRTYLTSWDQTASGPSCGPLFQAALGTGPVYFAGGTVASCTSAGRLTFGAAHGLAVGQAVACGGEIRFVSAIVDTATVQLNTGFTTTPGAGTAITATATYYPATELPSASIFDYWDPTAAVQRVLSGCAVDKLEILVNGDYHEFRFSGPGRDVLDSVNGSDLMASLDSFPAEPAAASFDYSIVSGNLGQAWLGVTPAQFFTITGGTVTLDNELDTRTREFGTAVPRAISPGIRKVTAAFDLFSQTDDDTKALYQAARQQSPITVMFQLGEQEGQVMAVNLKSVIAEVPEFDDSENRLQWKFKTTRGQGTGDDEITVAFA